MRFTLLSLLLLLHIVAMAQPPAAARVRAAILDADGYALESTYGGVLQSSDGERWQPRVGERVTLAVDVLTPTWFTRAPRFPHLKIRDAVSLRAETFATNFSERIDGQSFAVQRREYSIYPQRAGQFAIAGVEVEVWTAGGEKTGGEKLRSNPLLLQVLSLPDSPPSSPALVADDLVVSQELSVSDHWRVGDLVQRRITIEAQGTLGMLIQPLSLGGGDGTRQQRLSAEVSDSANRGEMRGRRIETWQYQLRRQGQWQLPEVQVRWWNRQSDSWQVSTLSAIPLQVQQAVLTDGKANTLSDGGSWREALPQLWRWSKWALLISAGVWILLWLLSRLLRKLYCGWQHWQASELADFLRLQRALSSGQAEAAVSCYYRWRRHHIDRQAAVIFPVEHLPDWELICEAARRQLPPQRELREVGRGLLQALQQQRYGKPDGMGSKLGLAKHLWARLVHNGDRASLMPLNPPQGTDKPP